MKTCSLIINSTCLKEMQDRNKSMICLKKKKLKSPTGLEMWLTRKGKKFRQLIKSEMVFLRLHRNGEQNKRYETKSIEFEERVA